MLRRAFWLVLLGLCSLAWAQDFDHDRYRLSVYLHAGNKSHNVRYGRCVYDLSQQKWWDKLCGEMLPRLGGPNFMINGLDKRSDWIVTVTYRSDTGATLKVYDGDSYLNLADLPAGEDWQTVEAQLSAEVLKGEKMDRGPGPAWDLLCAFEGGAIWVHRIEVRRAEPVQD